MRMRLTPASRSTVRSGIAIAPRGLLALACAGLLAAPAAAGPAKGAPVPSRPAAVANCTLPPLWSLATPPAPASFEGWAPRATGESFMTAARDPETGAWGLAPLAGPSGLAWFEAAAVSRATADLAEAPIATGGVKLDLRGRFQTISLASRAADGGVRFGCADHADPLHRWLFHGAPEGAAAWPEE